jgi:hypothetical protein
MTMAQKEGVKQAAKEFYQDRRISLKMALWAMKNAGSPGKRRMDGWKYQVQI